MALQSLILPSVVRAPAPAERIPVDRATRDQRLAAAVAAHFDVVWRSLRRLGVPEQDSDDAAQQVFLTLNARLSDVPAERERAFLLSVAVGVAANARRGLRRSRELPSDDVDAIGPEPTPEHALEQRQLLAELDRALAQLPEDFRTVFVLYEIEGFSLPEIARSLTLPLGTATSRLRRARELFEARISQRGGAGDGP